MKITRVFRASVALNLVLLGGVGWWLNRTGGDAVVEERGVVPAVLACPEGAARGPVCPPAGAARYVTNHFRWGQLETNDLVQLGVNLRAVGCPEATVRDLICARARRRLGAAGDFREAAPPPPFWTAGLKRERALREARRQSEAARGKVLLEVEAALGPDVFLEQAKFNEDFVDQAIQRFLSGPLDDQDLFKVRLLAERQEAVEDSIRSQAGGVMLEEDDQAVQAAARRTAAAIKSALSDSGFEELNARMGILKDLDKVNFEATDLSPAELRKVGLAYAAVAPLNILQGMKGPDLSAEQELQLTQQLRSALGPIQYAQYQRAADDEFKALFELGQTQELPRETAVQAYELRQLAGREVAKLSNDASLDPVQREQRLATLQSATQAAMLRVLGATACQQYLQGAGNWLTNVGGL